MERELQEAAEDIGRDRERAQSRRGVSPSRFSALVPWWILIAIRPAVSLTPEFLRRGLAAYEVRDYGQAMACLRPAANRGQAEAQFKVGVMFDQGWGVGKDDRAAAKWYRCAASQGHAKAMFNLGVKLSRFEVLERFPS